MAGARIQISNEGRIKLDAITGRVQAVEELSGCTDSDEIIVTFSGIVACECQSSGVSYLGTDLGGLNGSFVLPRTSSNVYQLTRGALFRVTKWAFADCTGPIEFEHESNCIVFASCNPATGRWTVAIQEQGNFFFAFFGRGFTNPIAAEGVCGYPISPDLFIGGSATVSL